MPDDSKDQNRSKHLSRAKLLLLLSSLSLLWLLLLTAASAEYTSRSDFCTSCHYMQPFYDSWKHSSHNQIECIQCHFAPGLKNKIRGKMEGLVQLFKYVTNIYKKSKPWAEIPDESCLRSGCHSTQLLENDGLVSFNNVSFEHGPHLLELRKGKKLRCTSCHSQIVQGDHITVTSSTCYICHFKQDDGLHDFKDISDCKICHKFDKLGGEALKTFRYDHTDVTQAGVDCRHCHDNVTVGNGAVRKENCFACHWEQERLEKLDDTDLMHRVHISTHKIECLQCHTPIEHKKPKNVEQMVSNCESCHTDQHKSQGILFAGSGGVLDKKIPNLMFEEGISCKGCHVFHGYSDSFGKLETTYLANQKSCETCHGKGYDRLLTQWKNLTARMTRLVKDNYQTTNQRFQVTKAKVKEPQLINKLLSDSKHNLSIVETGKSIHNITYATALLEKAHNDLNSSRQLMGLAKISDQQFESYKFIPNDCANCHLGIAETKSKVFGREFSHQAHVVNNEISCKQCHSNARSHGQLIMNKDNCLSCHHSGKINKTCEDCHALQAGIYRGKTHALGNTEPDVMFSSDVSCEDCHRVNQKISRDVRSQCVNCHDNDYADLLQEWKVSTATTVLEIEAALAGSNSLAPERVEAIRKAVRAVKEDGSQGSHNYFAIEEKLEKIRSELKKAALP